MNIVHSATMPAYTEEHSKNLFLKNHVNIYLYKPYIFCVVLILKIFVYNSDKSTVQQQQQEISHVKSNYCTVFYGIMGTLRKSQKLRSTFMSSYTNTKTIHSISFASQF